MANEEQIAALDQQIATHRDLAKVYATLFHGLIKENIPQGSAEKMCCAHITAIQSKHKPEK